MKIQKQNKKQQQKTMKISIVIPDRKIKI